ncbi:MAG: hypothetical protein JKY65_09160, partial [Planctomycetes bacterium]|nr:hypothetical protein [Planctomycetota bacterium]
MAPGDDYDDDGPDDGSTAEPPKETAEPPKEKERRSGGPPPASEKQIGFMNVLKDKVNLTDEEFVAILKDVAGTEVVGDLNVAQASEVIDEIQIKAKERNVNLESKASDKQIGFIKSLKRRAHLTDAEFTELLQEVAGVSALEEVGKRHASTLIDALQAKAKGGGGG